MAKGNLTVYSFDENSVQAARQCLLRFKHTGSVFLFHFQTVSELSWFAIPSGSRDIGCRPHTRARHRQEVHRCSSSAKLPSELPGDYSTEACRRLRECFHIPMPVDATNGCRPNPALLRLVRVRATSRSPRFPQVQCIDLLFRSIRCKLASLGRRRTLAYSTRSSSDIR